jgi:hypothetical protein
MNLKGQGKPSIFKILNEYVSSSGNRDAGIIAGCIDCKSGKIDIYSQGAIDKNNDLKLVCPASKPAITYLILKNNIDPDRKIDQWFPLDQGYTKSDRITIKMLLSNTSGIRDYVAMVKDKNHEESNQFTVDLAYKNKELAFNPGDSALYSNTGFNAAGIILERITNKKIDNLLKEYFKDIAPSIRMDDGKGNYPKGYMKPWPYHYSLSGFSGGVIGRIEDYLKMMDFICKQPEFKRMSTWVKEVNGEKWGLGIFGIGDRVLYDGNSGANLSLFCKIGDRILYIHSSNEMDNKRFQEYTDKLIPLLMSI